MSQKGWGTFLTSLLNNNPTNPHAYLGPHKKLIRLYRPSFEECFLEFEGKIVSMTKKKGGIFEYKTEKKISPTSYKVLFQDGIYRHDPYAFAPTLNDPLFCYFMEGRDIALYEKLGAHLLTIQGVEGVRFSVWAPNADSVCLISDMNHYDTENMPMTKIGYSGVFELFVPGVKEWLKYKFAIKKKGHTTFKADPFAFYSEMRPSTASVVFDVHRFPFTDKDWIKKREKREHHKQPMNIYEVHLGSWNRHDGKFLNYRDIAHRLSSYCKDMGYTHLELMPITEHPLDESWGYQVSGYFAVTSRFGTPEDFQYFVNHMHEEGLFVILDWVGGHFPTDTFALAQFDGSYLYEYDDPRLSYHPHWNTLVFDYGKPQVRNFLLASLLFFAKVMHVDGFRFDAVSSIIYLNFGRKEGEWRPNQYGGWENLEGMEFLKTANMMMGEYHKGVIMIAEESSSFPKVSHPVFAGGLGFDFKSNLGWMNDTLKFFSTPFSYRSDCYNLLTFYMMYAYSERFALFLSHDEVVHEKRSLLAKMPGTQEEQFAGLRLLYTMMMTMPGKKLIFMGGEFGQWNEWYEGEEIHWFLLNYDTHKGMKRCAREINHFYLENDSLWARDHDPSGFEWVTCQDAHSSVLAYWRIGEKKRHFVIHNCSQNYFHEYNFALHKYNEGKVIEVFNSDSDRFYGKNRVNVSPKLSQGILTVKLAPLSTLILELQP